MRSTIFVTSTAYASATSTATATVTTSLVLPVYSTSLVYTTSVSVRLTTSLVVRTSTSVQTDTLTTITTVTLTKTKTETNTVLGCGGGGSNGEPPILTTIIPTGDRPSSQCRPRRPDHRPTPSYPELLILVSKYVAQPLLRVDIWLMIFCFAGRKFDQIISSDNCLKISRRNSITLVDLYVQIRSDPPPPGFCPEISRVLTR